MLPGLKMGSLFCSLLNVKVIFRNFGALLEFSKSSQGCEARLAGPARKGNSRHPRDSGHGGTSKTAFSGARSPCPSGPRHPLRPSLLRHLMRGRQRVLRQRDAPAGRSAIAAPVAAPLCPAGCWWLGSGSRALPAPQSGCGDVAGVLKRPGAAGAETRAAGSLRWWFATPHRSSPGAPRAGLARKQEGRPLPPSPSPALRPAPRRPSLGGFCPGSTAGACPARRRQRRQG